MLLQLDEATVPGVHIETLPGVWPPSLFGRQLAALISKIYLDKKTVVDIGCGSGLQAIVAAKRGAISYASDIFKASVDCTSLNAKKSNVNVEARIGAGLEPWLTDKFDAVICNGPTFEMVDGPVDQTEGLQRLRPLSKVLLEVMEFAGEILNPNGIIIGLICGPYSQDVAFAAASDHGLSVELFWKLQYAGPLNGFGGSFEARAALESGFTQPLSDTDVLLRATAFVMRRGTEVSRLQLRSGSTKL